MFHFIQDLRFGLRTVKKHPGVSLIVVLTLALGIGANTMVFSIVDAVLLDSLPYHHPEQLVFVRDVQRNRPGFPATLPEYMSWKENSRDFLEVAAYLPSTANLSGERQPERVGALLTTASLLPVLQVTPLLGRNFRAADENSSSPVAMVSYELWQRRFGGDRNVLGKVVSLDARDVEIVGVLPRDLRERVPRYFGSGLPRDVWLPLQINAKSLANTGSHYLTVVGRIKAGLSFQQAQAKIEAVSRHLKEEGRRDGIILYDLKARLVGGLRPILLVLLAAVGFVLLIVCANVANVLLARATARQKEISIRMAMGAQRGRLIRQLLTESMLLAAGGGLFGMLLAVFGLQIVGTSDLGIPSGISFGINLPVLVFTLAVSLGTGLLFGVAPALRATLTDVSQNLKEGARQSGPGRMGQGLRSGLVVLEVTLAVLLLIGAGLLLRSFVTLINTDMGFDPDHVLTTEIAVSLPKYNSVEELISFYDQTLQRVRALPGVTEAGLIQVLPIPGGINSSMGIEGHTFEPGNQPMIDNRVIKGSYFKVMRIPLLLGREFQPQDHHQNAAPVAVVNQAFVRRFFPDQSPLGKKILTAGTSVSIVGVVGNVKSSPISTDSPPTAYFPYEFNWWGTMELVVRSTVDPLSLVGPIREQILKIDPEQPISRVRTLQSVMAHTLSRRAFLARVMAAFAGLALFLAAIGVYGVISYLVSERTREIGIRMALGAEYMTIQRLVLRRGLRMTLAGLVIGGIGSIALVRYLASQLPGVRAGDPFVYALCAAALFLTSLLACILPANRAARVDPLQALRHE